MPTSRPPAHRRAKARKYGAKDAIYQAKLKQYRLEKELGYSQPKYPPAGGNQDRERRRPNRRY